MKKTEKTQISWIKRIKHTTNKEHKEHLSLKPTTCNPNQTKFQANKGMVLFASMYRSRIKHKKIIDYHSKAMI
jgi:hypothetical protein